MTEPSAIDRVCDHCGQPEHRHVAVVGSGKVCPISGLSFSTAKSDTITRLQAALRGVEPYLDAIVCYASTMDEHEPNRIAFNVREAIKSVGGE